MFTEPGLTGLFCTFEIDTIRHSNGANELVISVLLCSAASSLLLCAELLEKHYVFGTHGGGVSWALGQEHLRADVEECEAEEHAL